MIYELTIDLETYSEVDLKTCGATKYAESDSFEILLFGVSVDGSAVKVYDIAGGETIPYEIIAAIFDKAVTKWAFNASFERICLSYWMKKHYPEFFVGYETTDETLLGFLDPSSWKCTMIWSAYLGLPLRLEDVGSVLKLDDQKMTEGKNLIRYFCKPCKPTKKNNGRTRNLPCHDPDKWELFKSYNKRDVEVEMEIRRRFERFHVPDFIWDEYHLDQMINDRGILIDMQLVNNAIGFNERSKSSITKQLKDITGLDNPNSVVQMKRWLIDKGMEVQSLGKDDVKKMLSSTSGMANKALSLRLQIAKSSVKKYEAMQNAACKDGRAHGMFQFYGANRSGRWSGRLIQLQNLPKNHMGNLEDVRGLVRCGDYETLELLYDDIPDILSQLIRTAFIPREGYKFIVSDFSSIEAVVLAYLSGEKWRTKVFNEGKDIYCASASKMFGVPVEKHGVNSHLRAKGKIAELALGYGGSVGALEAMGALEMGLSKEELQPLVDSWRMTNTMITAFWWEIDRAVKDSIKKYLPVQIHNIGFSYDGNFLLIRLPSGRKLYYAKPKITENVLGKESVSYMGKSPNGKWMRIESYGPKFVENIVQAISRDILSFAMKNLYDYFIVGHVHDELIIECKEDVPVEAITKAMSLSPDWLPNICLRAEGYATPFYKKE